MKNTKSILLGALIFLVGFIAYNLCIFLIIPYHSDVFWFSYIFTVIAFFAQLVVNLIFAQSNDRVQPLNLSLLYVSEIYFVLQMIVSIIFMLIPFPFVLPMIIQIVILAVYLIVALSTVLAINQIVETDTNIQNVTSYMKILTREAQQLYLMEKDIAKKAELKKLYEAIRYSDPMSTSVEIYDLDRQIDSVFRKLYQQVSFYTIDDLQREIKPILDLIIQRNQMCKSRK